jgi:hypothetical protein
MLESLATGNQLCLTTLRGLAPVFETARCVRWVAALRVVVEVAWRGGAATDRRRCLDGLET